MLLQAPGGNGKGGDGWEEGLHALDPGAWMKSTVCYCLQDLGHRQYFLHLIFLFQFSQALFPVIYH